MNEQIQIDLSAIMPEEAKKRCNLGQGEKCCAYLTSGPKGFICGKVIEGIKIIIDEKLARNKMIAKWTGCL